MASLNISELLFGMVFFKKFTEFINTSFEEVYAPNTALEGDPNYRWAGSDLVIEDYVFQLKMADFISAKNSKKRKFLNSQSYFQFTVKNKPTKRFKSCQLDLLKKISKNNKNRKVFYAAPFFEPELKTGEIWFKNFANSHSDRINEFISFIDIRSIPISFIEKNDTHKICFNNYTKNRGYAIYFSKPKIIKCNPISAIKNEIVLNHEWSFFVENYPNVSRIISDFRVLLSKYDKSFEAKKYSDIEVINYLAFEYNIFWIPKILSPQINFNVKIDKINSWNNI